ncbi:MAG: hypothetical protein KY464_14780, partial [Gemmatimonadetes bacterium]|nr:hypothetical protein [Gemmatimonadota bacterium]
RDSAVGERERAVLPPAPHNWVFRRNYPGADRLFNAFDYGHAILYEKLYTRPGAPTSLLEEDEYDFITRKLLASPPRMPLEEAAIEVEYVKLAPEAKLMFEWAHLLHRQIYDVLGDARLSQEDQDREVADLLRYYKSRPDLAFSSIPKTMELMEGQYYSTAFRKAYPKFNGLIWGYHWLQVGLYEPLLLGRTPEERQSGVTATVARFRQMLVNAPENLPRIMPMTAAVAPEFAQRYPEAAIIFDNLHSMHDVISDILASPEVPRSKKRDEILRAARRYRDATSFTMTAAEWLEMSRMMGVNNMGGPVTGFLTGFPEPTVERGAVMAGMDHSAMGHAPTGGVAGSDAHAGHGTGEAPAEAAGESGTGAGSMTELHDRMMADPVIRARVAADTALSRLMAQAHPTAGVGSAAGVDPSASDAARALDFIARLLSDPAVEARIHMDARLHALWSDPAVQRRLAEIRRAEGAQPASANQHQH